MDTISQAFGIDTFTLSQVSNTMASAATSEGKQGHATTYKTNNTFFQNPIYPLMYRVPLYELEQLYLRDSTVFNAVNKTAQTIMSASHQVVAKDKKVQEYFDNFTAGVGEHGGDLTWEESLSQTFINTSIFGRSWYEKIFNTKGNRILDLGMVDTKTIDYAKSDRMRITLDSYGKTVGYTQTLPLDLFSMGGYKRLNPPKNVYLQPNQLFIPPEKLAQIKLYTFGDGFYPVGLIEPIYVNSVRKQNTEEALANWIWRHGFPIMWAKLGDLQHEPSPQQIQAMLEKLKDLTSKKEIATPYYYDLSMVESKQATQLQDHLLYFQNQQVTGLGMPKPFALGLGEATNRSTLSTMSDLWQLTLRDNVTRVVNSIRTTVFKPICKQEGFKEVPTIDWDMVGIDEVDRKAKRIVNYIKAGLLQDTFEKDKISEYIRKSEDLD